MTGMRQAVSRQRERGGIALLILFSGIVALPAVATAADQHVQSYSKSVDIDQACEERAPPDDNPDGFDNPTVGGHSDPGGSSGGQAPCGHLAVPEKKPVKEKPAFDMTNPNLITKYVEPSPAQQIADCKKRIEYYEGVLRVQKRVEEIAGVQDLTAKRDASENIVGCQLTIERLSKKSGK